MEESNSYFRVPDTPAFSSYDEACDFYRDHCDKGYYKMDIYENISVHKCFEVEDQFVLQLKSTPKKTKFKPKPFKPKPFKSKPFKLQSSPDNYSEEVKQTVANSRESAAIARNKVESKPYTL